MPKTFPIPPALRARWDALEGALAGFERLAVAYSGGVDSTFLVWFAREALGKEVLACLVASPLQSEREHRWALGVAQQLALPLELIPVDPLTIPAVQGNARDRCYHCKRAILSAVQLRARALGCAAVVEGTHAGDREGYRPGKRALDELGILNPLATAGLEKADLRELSRLAGLPTWNKPSQSCLATRVPYDVSLTPELLSRIDRAEALLWALGCAQVRVRVHGDLARIELDREAQARLLESSVRNELLARFRELGFQHTCIDLAGYQSGTWDKNL